MSSFKPRAVQGVTKYGPKGLFSATSFNNFNFDSEYKEFLQNAANHSLSQKSWSAYKTAEKMLQRCREDTGTVMHLPLTEKDVLLFVAWLIKRDLQAKTISSYLSGIRMLHLRKGLYIPALRSDLVKQVIEGRVHLDAIKRRTEDKPMRIPVTPTLLKIMKLELKSSNLSKADKRLVWAISCLGFAGGFRVHELLARQETRFDPLFTLLNKDVSVKQIKLTGEKIETLQIKLKSQKTDRIGVDTIVDVYESGGNLCPVRAYKQWKKTSNQDDGSLPAFRLESGKPLTGKKFNFHLKKLLERHLDYNTERVTSHSFRAGIATLMGQLGYTDDDIKALGRWSSKAFEVYLKLPRTRRLEMAREIGRLNL